MVGTGAHRRDPGSAGKSLLTWVATTAPCSPSTDLLNRMFALCGLFYFKIHFIVVCTWVLFDSKMSLKIFPRASPRAAPRRPLLLVSVLPSCLGHNLDPFRTFLGQARSRQTYCKPICVCVCVCACARVHVPFSHHRCPRLTSQIHFSG